MPGTRRSGSHKAFLSEPLVREHLLVTFVSRDRSAVIPFAVFVLPFAPASDGFMLIPYTGMRRDQGARAAGGTRNGSR